MVMVFATLAVSCVLSPIDFTGKSCAVGGCPAGYDCVDAKCARPAGSGGGSGGTGGIGGTGGTGGAATDAGEPDVPSVDASVGADADAATPPTGHPLFVAVGDLGARAWSTDGVTWTGSSSNPDGGISMYGVAYGDQRFIAVGDDVQSTQDGTTWTSLHYNKPGSTFTSIVYSPQGSSQGVWIAAGLHGVRMRSIDDGQTWIDYTADSTEAWYRGLAVGGGLTVAVGSSPMSPPLAFWSSSSDLGHTWTPVAGMGAGFFSVAFGNGVFVAAATETSRVSTTPDGVRWNDTTLSAPSAPDGVGQVQFVDGAFFVTGGDGYWTSTDGSAWTRVEVFIPPIITHAVSAGGDVYVGIQYSQIFRSEWFGAFNNNVVFTSDQTLRGLAFGQVP